MRSISRITALTLIAAGAATSLQAQGQSPQLTQQQCLQAAHTAHNTAVADCARRNTRPDQITTCRQRADNTRMTATTRCDTAFDQAMRQMERRRLEAEQRASSRSPRPQ